MTDHTTMPQISRLEVIATGARRRWTPEAKLGIVAESYALPRNVSATARRHAMSTGQLFTWRRQVREGKLAMVDDGVGFVRAVIAEGAPVLTGREVAADVARPTTQAGTQMPMTGRMEIVLAGSRKIIAGNDVDVETLARVIAALERR